MLEYNKKPSCRWSVPTVRGCRNFRRPANDFRVMRKNLCDLILVLQGASVVADSIKQAVIPVERARRSSREVAEKRGLVNYRVKFNAGEKKTFHINMLKKYNEKEKSKGMTVNELPEREKEIVGEEQPNDEVDQEEPVIGVVEDSEDEEEKSEIMRNRRTESVAAMEVVVDSNSEEEEVQCQEKLGNSDVGILRTFVLDEDILSTHCDKSDVM